MKAQHKIFADEIIKHSDHIRAYKKAYPTAKSKQTIIVNANRLLKNANLSAYIKQQSEKISNLAANKAADELKDEIKADVLTVIQKRNILSRIMRGELEVERIIVTAEGIKKVKSKPSHLDIMKAVEIDSKMAGDFAPTKVAQTDTKGNDLPKYDNLSVDELKILFELEKKAAM